MAIASKTSPPPKPRCYDEARFRETSGPCARRASIEVLDVRPGDLIAPNTPVATLLERDQIYVASTFPKRKSAACISGRRPRFAWTPFPIRFSTVTVEQINQQAEFLPRNVQTVEERVPPGLWREGAH